MTHDALTTVCAQGTSELTHSLPMRGSLRSRSEDLERWSSGVLLLPVWFALSFRNADVLVSFGVCLLSGFFIGISLASRIHQVEHLPCYASSDALLSCPSSSVHVILLVKSEFDALALCTPVRALIALLVDHLHYLSKSPGQSARTTPQIFSCKFKGEDVRGRIIESATVSNMH